MLLGCTLSGLASLAIGADEYPNRPVAIVVPFTPGASTDTLARFEADVLQRALHQSFVVENRPIAGGSGSIGLAAKIANSIGRSNTLRKAYAPVDIEAVRSVDDARVKGRRHMRAENIGAYVTRDCEYNFFSLIVARQAQRREVIAVIFVGFSLGGSMKKIAIGIALASMAPWCSPAFAQQIVSGAGSVALNATGEADGVAFINQGVNETTLSATIGQNINTNQNAVGVSTNAANRGNILFSGGAGGFLQFLER